MDGKKRLPAPIVPLWILIIMIGVVALLIRARVDKPEGGIKIKESYIYYKDDEELLTSRSYYDKKGNLDKLEIYDDKDKDKDDPIETYEYKYTYDKDDKITKISCDADCGKNVVVMLDADYDEDGILKSYTLIYQDDGKEYRRVEYDEHLNMTRDRRFQNDMTVYMEDRCYDSVGRMIRQEVFTADPMSGNMVLSALVELRYETKGLKTYVYVKDYFGDDPDEEFLGKYLETDDRGKLKKDEDIDPDNEDKMTGYSKYTYYQ